MFVVTMYWTDCYAAGFELIEFLQRGCGAAPQYDFGLRRRNNEFNELPGRSGAGDCP